MTRWHAFLNLVREALREAVSDVRASDRLTDSAVCLVASESGLDRQLEKLLANAGQLPSAKKPVLEVNPGHAQIPWLTALPSDDSLRADAAHILLDEARIVDGELPLDPRAFTDRLGRLIQHACDRVRADLRVRRQFSHPSFPRPLTPDAAPNLGTSIWQESMEA